jgi:hypothetical protein
LLKANHIFAPQHTTAQVNERRKIAKLISTKVCQLHFFQVLFQHFKTIIWNQDTNIVNL